MSKQDELQEVADALISDDAKRRARLLKIIANDPFKDERILPYIEKFIDDQTPCLIMIPYRFAEIRYLAAKAFNAEREVLGLGKCGRTLEVVRPMDTEELIRITDQHIAESSNKPGPDGLLEDLMTLNELNVLPKMELEI